MKPFYLTFLLVFVSNIMLSQQNDNSAFFETFNAFFEDNISRQGIKGDWIFELNEITGMHKFDFNNDKELDVLVEFTASPVEGGGAIYFYTVLFENIINQDYRMLGYFNSKNLQFSSYFESEFRFVKEANSKNSYTVAYQLINEEFIQIK